MMNPLPQKFKALLTLALFLGIFGSMLHAQKTWDGGGMDDNWSTAANWNPDGVPGAGDDVTFDASVSNKACVVDVSAEVNNLTINTNSTLGKGASAGQIRIKGNLNITQFGLLELSMIVEGDVNITDDTIDMGGLPGGITMAGSGTTTFTGKRPQNIRYPKLIIDKSNRADVVKLNSSIELLGYAAIGMTKVTKGILDLNGKTLSSAGGMAVEADGTLRGAGNIYTNQPLELDGILEVDDIVSIFAPLHITGSLKYDISGRGDVIGGGTAGVDFDQIDASKLIDATAGGTIDLDFSTRPTVGDQYTLIHGTGLVGLANLTLITNYDTSHTYRLDLVHQGGFVWDIILTIVSGQTTSLDFIDSNTQALLNIYPNPARQSLYVEWKQALDAPATMSLYDLQGREVKSQRINQNIPPSPVRLDVQDLAKGTYILQLNWEKRQYQQKVIIW